MARIQESLHRVLCRFFAARRQNRHLYAAAAVFLLLVSCLSILPPITTATANSARIENALPAGKTETSEPLTAAKTEATETSPDTKTEASETSPNATADAPSVTFMADHFSVYAIVGTTIEKTVLASDGRNYKITAVCGPDAKLPDDAELEVNEITRNADNYSDYISKTENALGWEAGSALSARVFDISIVKNGEKLQPAPGAFVEVSIRLLDREEYAQTPSIVHFADDAKEGSVVGDVSAGAGEVCFAAEGFSVYVIVNHEGDEQIVTPRVEFHFIDPAYTEQVDGQTGTISLQAAAYEFVNKNGEYQITQILQDGEGLEKITNPANIIVTNQDGTTSEKYFYGWYLVDGSGNENISYIWTDDPEKIPFELAADISYDEGAKTVTWSLDGATHTDEADELGCAHVYLAPIFEDYYFVNFHMNSAGSEGELKNSILTRRLAVFGNDNLAEVRIGDVVCDSPDPRHQIFAGWQETAGPDYYATVDADGNEANSPGRDDGYYITVEKTEGQSVYTYDLYPVFAEARWLHFHTGMSGNGASYVAAQYRLTNDEERGSAFTSLPVPTRPGYVFKGWYMDQDNEYNGTGLQLTDGSGAFADGIIGQTFSEGGEKAWEVTEDEELYFYKGLSLDGMNVYALWEPETVDYTVVYWLQNADDDNYTLMHYQTQQGVAGELTEAVEILASSSVYENNKLKFCHLSADQDQEAAGSQSGIQQHVIEGDGSTIVNVYYDRDVYTLRFDIGFARQTSPNGSTTTYETMTQEEAMASSDTVYGLVGDTYVALTPDGNGGWTYAGTESVRHVYTEERYRETTGTGLPQYGVADGSVVELALDQATVRANGYRYQVTTANSGTQYGIFNNAINRVYYARNQWRQTNNNNGTIYSGTRYTRSNAVNSGAEYTGDIYHVANNGFSLTGSGATYGYDGTYYFPVTESTVWTYNSGTSYGTAPRYTRVENAAADTSHALGFIDGSMQSISRDADGWYYTTEEPAAVSYTGNLYGQSTLAGTWQYSVSNTTGPNYAAADNWDTFLTQKRYDQSL